MRENERNSCVKLLSSTLVYYGDPVICVEHIRSQQYKTVMRHIWLNITNESCHKPYIPEFSVCRGVLCHILSTKNFGTMAPNVALQAFGVLHRKLFNENRKKKKKKSCQGTLL